MDTKEIAARLLFVDNHRSNMFERLGAGDTTALEQLDKINRMI